jgi:hypothetical protein
MRTVSAMSTSYHHYHMGLPNTHRGQIISGPGSLAAPVLAQPLQGPHGSHLSLDLDHV